MDVTLRRIPEEAYAAYRKELIFRACKWDPQVRDQGTIARHAAVLSPDCAARLAAWAERLAEETAAMEAELALRPALHKSLALPAELLRGLRKMHNYRPEEHIRLMRFDFHPVEDREGWAVSEVNSDVPGGLAEASAWPGIACARLSGCEPGENVAAHLLRAFAQLVPVGGQIAFVHCTAYADDRQVMQYLAREFTQAGYTAHFAAPDHIRWRGKKALLLAGDEAIELDGLLRFFPLEWMPNLPRSARWRDWLSGTTPQCSHPAAMLTQSKRLPLVWKRLSCPHDAWESLLPKTVDPRQRRGDMILKPALGRVGEGVLIPGAVGDKERKRIEQAAWRHPKHWIAQERFRGGAIEDEIGQNWHLCVGAFTVNGRFAGFYGRMSQSPRIDAGAQDIAIVIGR